MLILIVVISILTTNLFLGFLVAHYLGYGPKNFHELLTGIDPRPLPDGGIAPRPDPIAPTTLAEFAQAAAANPPTPSPQTDWAAFVSQYASTPTTPPAPTSVADRELIHTVLHSNLALQQAGLLMDYERMVTASPTSAPPHAHPSGGSEPAEADHPSQPWTEQTPHDVLIAWERYLQSVALANTTPWWKSFLRQWRETQQAWLAYETTVRVRRRLIDAHQQWLAKSTEVVCDDNSCRRVSKAAGQSQWWQRPSAEWRTLTWAQGQVEACERETFERLVLARQQTQQLFRQSCHWLRQTFKPSLLREQAAQLDARLFPGGLEAELQDNNKSHGALFLLKTKQDWIADYCRGTMVTEAILQHRAQRLDDWFQALPNLSDDGQQPLRQLIDPWTAALWVPSENAASARVAAWTVIDKLESSARQIDRQIVSLDLRLLIVPLTAKRPVQAALQAALTWTEPLDATLWEPGGNIVWTQADRRPEPVPRPDALPRLDGELDLTAWYKSLLLGIDPATPAGEAGEEDALPKSPSPQPVEQSTDKHDNRTVAESAAPPAEDDGIDW
jgi:hypothetical protein